MNDNNRISSCDEQCSSYACFRLPLAERGVMVRGEAVEVPSAHELNGRQGFVVAPFHATPSQPLLLIEPKVVETCEVPSLRLDKVSSVDIGQPVSNDARSRYSVVFEAFYYALKARRFRKLVLASV